MKALGLALALLAVASPLRAQTGDFGIEFDTVPEVKVCHTLKEETAASCPLTSIFLKWMGNRREERKERLATAGMETERAALTWARGRYPGDRYRVQITGSEEIPTMNAKLPARAVTMAVYQRKGDWMTRQRVVVSPGKTGWRVRAD